MACPAFLVFTLFQDGPFDGCKVRLLCSADLHCPLVWLAKKGVCVFPEYIQEKTHTPFLANCIIVYVLPLFMCFKGDSNLPLENCFLQFCLAFKSSSLPYLNIFLDDSYHLYPCRFVNCSAPELHFSTRFFGSWPPNLRIASGPILVLGGRLSLCLILLPDWKLEWPVPFQTPRASLSLVPPLPVHPLDKLQTVRNRRLNVLILQVESLLVKRLEGWTRLPGDEEMTCLFQTLPDQTGYHLLCVTGMF